MKSYFWFRLCRNQNKDLKFQFRIDRNAKKHIPVPVRRTGLVAGLIRFPVPVLKPPFGRTLTGYMYQYVKKWVIMTGQMYQYQYVKRWSWLDKCTNMSRDKIINGHMYQYVRSRAAEYGERWEHCSQEISAKKWPCQEIWVKKQTCQEIWKKNPGSWKTYSVSRNIELS